MFERNSIDSPAKRQPVAIELILDDGRTLSGKVAVPPGKGVIDVLNGPGGFFEFQPFVGEREIVAKDTVRSVKFVAVAAARPLRAEDDDIGGFNPYRVLGIDKGASAEDMRRAYLRLSKSYHPDVYAGTDLPREVSNYLAAVARRINQAYEMLKEGEPGAKASNAPIFQSGGKARPAQTSSSAVS
jgi:DnaJ domain